MKKSYLFLVVAITLLISSFAIAASVDLGTPAREPTTFHEGKTNFANIGIQGVNKAGVPGYIEIVGMQSNTVTPVQYYLWVDSTGDLRIASRVTMIAYSSFPDVTSWGVAGSMGTVVGSQS